MGRDRRVVNTHHELMTDPQSARPQTPAPILSAHECRCVAAAGTIGQRTVSRYLEGKPGKSTTDARVEFGLRACGLAHLVRARG